MKLPDQQNIDDVREALLPEEKLPFDVYVARARVEEFKDSPYGQLIQATSQGISK